MVVSPALRAASQALLQLQSLTNTQIKLTNSTFFKDEVTQRLGQHTLSTQNITLINTAARPVAFIPLLAEMCTQASPQSTTQRRTKKTKPPRNSGGNPVKNLSRKS